MTVATDDSPAPAAPPPSPDGPPETSSRMATPVVPWAVAALALLLAAFSTVQWLGLKGDADDRADVAVAASAFLLDLINWDASDGLDDTVKALRDRGTGRFLAQAEDLFGGPLGDELEVADARSEGEIEDLFVQSVDGDVAEVFAVVRQSVASAVTSGSERRVRQVIIQLERVEGSWRIENLELPELVADPGAGEEDG